MGHVGAAFCFLCLMGCRGGRKADKILLLRRTTMRGIHGDEATRQVVEILQECKVKIYLERKKN